MAQGQWLENLLQTFGLLHLKEQSVEEAYARHGTGLVRTLMGMASALAPWSVRVSTTAIKHTI